MSDRPLPWRRPDGVTTDELVSRSRARAAVAAARQADEPPAPVAAPTSPAEDRPLSGTTARCPVCHRVLEPVLNARQIEVFPKHPNEANPKTKCANSGYQVTWDDRRNVVRGEPR